MAHRIWTMQEKFLNICKYGERSEMISKYQLNKYRLFR